MVLQPLLLQAAAAAPDEAARMHGRADWQTSTATVAAHCQIYFLGLALDLLYHAALHILGCSIVPVIGAYPCLLHTMQVGHTRDNNMTLWWAIVGARTRNIATEDPSAAHPQAETQQFVSGTHRQSLRSFIIG